jgi:hypothetical protein
MKRNSLTTALLAGLAGAAGLASTAQAVNLNPDGLGQVLIYPYYTVNKNNNTLISVVNTTSDVKAVKVRFLEGKNSAEVLDFNLYLSPFDVWTGAVIGLTNVGGGNLITGDKSCTVPIIGNQTIPFRNTEYSGAKNDKGGTGLNRTREGYLEMIEMGVVVEDSSEAIAATHVDGIPDDCVFVENQWKAGGDWTNSDGANNVTFPAGGLYGAGTIVDVANGTLHAYTADAIEGFFSGSPAAFLHSNPGSTFPSLAQAETGDTGVATTFVFQSNGTLVTSDWVTGTDDAVSALYMHNAIFNEYVTSPALGATSEWVVTFPTKRFYVNHAAPADPPFTDVFPDNGSACEEIGIAYWDREEQVPGTPPGTIDFSPLPPETPAGVPVLCYEAQVVTFNQEAAVTAGASLIFGSTYASNINTLIGTPPDEFTANTGHAQLNFDTDPDHVLTDALGTEYAGLPVTGFWSVNYVNAAAQPGKLANYSGAYRHRASRSITAAPPPG